jgi:hypothetical protein
MTNRFHLSIGNTLTAIALLALLGGCRGPEGPAGPPGESTILQLDGFAPGIKCGSCHNPDTDTVYYVWAKKYQWERSKHFFGGEFERNQAPCSGCHTTEGYVQRMLRGNPPLTSANWAGVVTSHPNASPPGCFACHSPHSRGNFSLRTTAPVTPVSPTTAAIPAIDYGKGNLCISCHQPRPMSPVLPVSPAATDSVTITTSRWHPHYGVQSTMLAGVGGFQIPGYTYTGNSPHATLPAIKQEGCVICHMAPSTVGSGIAGDHTMNVRFINLSGVEAWNVNGCLRSGCHATMTSVENYVSTSSTLTGGMGVRKYVSMYLDTLFTELVRRNYIVPTTGLVNASTTRPLRIPARKAGALYNYFFLKHDFSMGMHNSKYAIELLRSSIEEIRKP